VAAAQILKNGGCLLHRSVTRPVTEGEGGEVCVCVCVCVDEEFLPPSLHSLEILLLEASICFLSVYREGLWHHRNYEIERVGACPASRDSLSGVFSNPEET